MSGADTDVDRHLLSQARHSLAELYLPRITRCLEQLSEKDIWWRPNRASNSVGNLVLHLSGNVRQWIISGLGGAPDVRQRDQEFAECGPMPRRVLTARLSGAVAEACEVLDRLSGQDLASDHLIQGFHVSGFEAVYHVAEHFAYHTGQILFIAKLKSGKNLGFTRLPGEKRKGKALPAI